MTIDFSFWHGHWVSTFSVLRFDYHVTCKIHITRKNNSFIYERQKAVLKRFHSRVHMLPTLTNILRFKDFCQHACEVVFCQLWISEVVHWVPREFCELRNPLTLDKMNCNNMQKMRLLHLHVQISAAKQRMLVCILVD